MKKVYKTIVTSVLAALSANTINAATDPSITIIGFENTETINQTAPGSNSTVQIQFTGASIVTIPTTPSFTLDGQMLPAGFKYLQIAKAGTVTVTRPSTTNDVLENVVIWCSSVTASAEVQPAWNTFQQPETFTDEYYGLTAVTGLSNLGDKAYPYFPLVNNYGDGNLTDFITAYNEGAIETKPADINAIRFTVTNTTSDPLNIYGIYVYTTLKSTQIEAPETLENKTPVEVTYYDMTGKKVTPERKGLVIKRTVYSDGSTQNQKIYKQ